MQLRAGDAHLIFNGQSRKLKLFVYGEGNPRRIWDAHDVGVNDAYIGAGEDMYGHLCKAPPGVGYILGGPMYCGPQSSDGAAYGYWFTPIFDNAQSTFAIHGRAGIGIHGGGSDLANPFAPQQGWEYTFGCIRMQNVDNGMQVPAVGTFVNAVQYLQKRGGTCYLDIVWP